MKTTTSKDFAKIIREALNIKLFDNNSYHAGRDAFANLSGKTHYVDPDTLRYFHIRIVYAQPAECGLIYWIIESAAKDHENKTRGFRFVAFDLFGTVLHRAKLEDMTRTSDQAKKQFYAWFETFDAVNHYKTAFATMAEKSKREALEYRKLSRGFKAE